jgi:hypothetical protein
MNDCNCTVCKGRNYNKEGIELAEAEVIPFFKTELLKLRYPNHPFPLKYKGLFASVLCYSQALAYNRAHSISAVFHTDNKWMLKFSGQLAEKFGMKTDHTDNRPEDCGLACEFNVQEQA